MLHVRYKNPKIEFWPLLLILSRISITACFELTQGDPDVEFEKADDGFYKLTLDENLSNKVLFYIKDANEIRRVDPDKACSDIKFEYSNTQLSLDKPLDYENADCRITKNIIYDDKGLSAVFKIDVRNLDDNKPQFEIGENCKLNENTPYTKENTTCNIIMTDSDGMMDEAILMINDDFGFFKVDFQPPPSKEDQQATVAIYLIDKKTLDFEKRYSYVLKINVQEQINSADVKVAIDVGDLADEPPKFTKLITTEQFEENIDQVFTVSAEDGDVGINSTISFNITINGCDKVDCIITISENGEIHVKNVDREKTGDTIPLTIEAIEDDDKSSTPLSITFFIIDQDDEIPQISIDQWNVSKEEGYKGTITTFNVTDMDLSNNGTYNISMDNAGSSIEYSKAFKLIPDSGYHAATFSLIVVDSSLLNYENENWKIIKINILAIEEADSTHKDSHEIIINLIDVNDEYPVFVDEDNSVDIPEDIEAGQIIFNATAVDADAGDEVSYEIKSVWKQRLAISKNGIITTKIDNAFDFEQQQEVIITIQASDKVNHITSKTLTINVQDVDDEPPVLRVIITNDDRMAKIPENSADGTVVDGVSIVVTDPDTDPKLKLEIDWQQSYVTKNGNMKKLEDNEYQCFSVKSQSKDKQTLDGTIFIKGTEAQECPDFEKFDAIVIYLKAIDENTKIGDDATSVPVTVNIGDLNDNTPYFIDSSLKDLAVTDGTKDAIKIGVITTHDDDISDEPHFSIKPYDPSADWVDIDEKTGQLTVKKNVEIDCDKPKRADIKFNITVSDTVHTNTTELSIRIDDTNDEYPKIIFSNTEERIDELSPEGTKVATLKSTDDDRDDPNNRVVFKFETNLTNDASNRFVISSDGVVSVALRNGAILDRDNGATSYILPIVAYDNPNGILQHTTHVDLKVILNDLDNNIPKLDTKTLNCVENLTKDKTLGKIIAIDPDEDGPNSDVEFDLTNVLPLNKENKNQLELKFFTITKTDAKTASIGITQNLEGYWGVYNLTIRTKDKGNPSAFNDNVITLSVDKFNFYAPVFVFPNTEDDKKITIDKDAILPNNIIPLISGKDLKHIEVDDKQDHKWIVTFEIKTVNGVSQDIFTVKRLSSHWKADLMLTRTLSEEEMSETYSVTVKAAVKDDMKSGEEGVSVETTFKINFYSSSQPPEFDIHQALLEMQEEDETISMPIPETAHIPSSYLGLKPYYFISETSDTFKVDPDDGTISLIQKLDYEQKAEYKIQIIAMNKITTPKPDKNNVLNLTIQVIDVNDNPPIFHPNKFTGAFLRNYAKGTTILTVNATDADPTLQALEYELKNFTCSETLKTPTTEDPFAIGPKDGKITNSFTVTSDMSGYCNFIVEVKDEKNNNVPNDIIHLVDTTVQINVISNDELVKFTFLNPDWYVNQELDNVTSIINEAFKEYNYKCFLADLTYDSEWHNTTAHFYFTNSQSEPVPAEEIMGNLTDPYKYSSLTKVLETIEVHLSYFSNENVTKVVDDYLKIWMITAICVLGALLALVTIIFFFRNRALTQRIKNLSTTKFGSQDSGLNRAGVTSPTTNKNAIEGSNPVFNSENYIKEVEDDRMSVRSGDSDLLGIENNPNFQF